MTCPICQNSPSKDFLPFCSGICKNNDLLGWLNERYRIPGEDFVQEEKGSDEESD